MENTENFSSQISVIYNEKVRIFLQKFQNGGIDKLIEKWWRYYFNRQEVFQDEIEFQTHLRDQINICIDYISNRREKNDVLEVNKIHWIKETYKELLYDNGQDSPKQEVLIEKVGARGKVLRVLDWVRGK